MNECLGEQMGFPSENIASGYCWDSPMLLVLKFSESCISQFKCQIDHFEFSGSISHQYGDTEHSFPYDPNRRSPLTGSKVHEIEITLKTKSTNLGD